MSVTLIQGVEAKGLMKEAVFVKANTIYDGKLEKPFLEGKDSLPGIKRPLKRTDPNPLLQSEDALEQSPAFEVLDGAALDESGGSYNAEVAFFPMSSGVMVASTETTLTELKESGTPTAAPTSVAWGGGLLLILGSGGVSLGVGAGASGSVLHGVIMAGPVAPGNQLTVNVYRPDGTLIVGNVALKENGQFDANVGTYSGPLAITVVDSGNGSDFIDEATGEPKDLSAMLMAVVVVTDGGFNGILNVNPLTTIAAQRAGLSADGRGTITAQSVNAANQEVAQLFGLADITSADIITTVNADGSSNSTSANHYGLILAALSGMDLNNTGSMQTTIDTLVGNISTDGSTFTAQVQDLIVSGARATGLNSGQLGSIVGVIDKTAPTLTITDDVTAQTATDVVQYTFTFSEGVMGFDATHLHITGGSLSTLTYVNPQTYTVGVTPVANISNGTISLTVNPVGVTDLAGNAVTQTTQLTHEQAYNTVRPDTTAPILLSAAVTGNTLTLSFDSNLDTTNLPSINFFSVGFVGHGSIPGSFLQSLIVNGPLMTLTLPFVASPSGSYTLNYADPTSGNDAHAIQDLSGNDVASFINVPIAYVGDTAAPTFQSAVVNGSQLTLAYNEELNSVSVPDTSNFVVKVNGTPVDLDGVFVEGNQVHLWVPTVTPNDLVTVAYIDPTASHDVLALHDLAGNDAGSFEPTQVTNVTPPPVIDLGSYGKLIAPTYVDGDTNPYYFWDRSGDGSNAGIDYVSHDVLDLLFTQDIHGTASENGRTDDGLRYVTLNDAQNISRKLALPIAGVGALNQFFPSTALQGPATNATYDGLMAVWDANNGAVVAHTGVPGVPTQWQSAGYWTATQSGSGYAMVDLSNGMASELISAGNYWVALQLIL